MAGSLSVVTSSSAPAVAAVMLTLAGAGIGQESKKPAAKENTRPASIGVKSYQCRLTSVTEYDGKKAGGAARLYWAARGSERLDGRPPEEAFEKVAAYAAQADRKLGKRQFKGKSAPGFEIDLRKVNPDQFITWGGNLRAWIDSDTGLPLRVETEKVFHSPTNKPGAPAAPTTLSVYEDFEWNTPAAKGLDLKPHGYRVDTPPPSDLAVITPVIVEAFKTYAKHSGGKYPQVRMVFPDVLGQHLERLYAEAGKEPDDSLYRAVGGFREVMFIQWHNPAAAYHGKMVGPADKDKVLLRWRLKDGRYRVVFGDLRFEDVDAAKLKKLEGR